MRSRVHYCTSCYYDLRTLSFSLYSYDISLPSVSLVASRDLYGPLQVKYFACRFSEGAPWDASGIPLVWGLLELLYEKLLSPTTQSPICMFLRTQP